MLFKGKRRAHFCHFGVRMPSFDEGRCCIANLGRQLLHTPQVLWVKTLLTYYAFALFEKTLQICRKRRLNTLGALGAITGGGGVA